MPTSVRTDSGWNCTPSMPSLGWRRPMMRPSASAEISRPCGQAFPFDDERVVARGHEVLRQLAKNRFVVVMDAAGLAVHDFRRANDASAESVADGLMAQADAEQRNFAPELADDFDDDAGFFRRAGAGGNHDAVGLLGGDIGEGDLVVAMDFELFAQLAEILRQVIGERIVVVDEQDHRLDSLQALSERFFAAPRMRSFRMISAYGISARRAISRGTSACAMRTCRWICSAMLVLRLRIYRRRRDGQSPERRSARALC